MGLVVDIKKTGELSKHLPDLQQEEDSRGVGLPKVGIRNLRVPVKVYKKPVVQSDIVTDYGDPISTIADFSVYVNLTEETRGINMSRIPLILYRYLDKVAIETISSFIDDVKKELGCSDVYVKVKFPYTVGKKSPGSQLNGVEVYDCVLEAKLVNGATKYYLTVKVQTISTCPCSKELGLHSEQNGGSRGAPHMQRGFVTVTVEYDPTDMVWIEDLVKEIEQTVVTVPYPVVKRIDEQAIALQTWEHPRFVEDVARDVSLTLDNYSAAKDYVIVAEHEETIHTHNVVAVKYKGIEGGLR